VAAATQIFERGLLRPTVPVLCRYRPNRSSKRTYTRDDAARVVCYALDAISKSKNITEDVDRDGVNLNRQGGRTVGSVNLRGPVQFFDRDLQDILQRVELKCGAKSSKPKDFADAAAAEAQRITAELSVDAIAAGALGSLQEAQAQIDEDNRVFTNILEWLSTFVVFLTILSTALRLVPVPAVRLAAVGLPAAIKRIAGFQGAIIARKAANDRTWIMIERAKQLLQAA